MPIAMERGLTPLGLFGMANNQQFRCKSYVQIMPSGPEPMLGRSAGFFETAAGQSPKPETVAVVGADAEYPHDALSGAGEHVKRLGFKVVYDGKDPPATADYTPIVRAIKASNPELGYVASCPPGTVGMILPAHEVGLQPKMFGAAWSGCSSPPSNPRSAGSSTES
jgi:branched-chain amino acid transport system substrate-binding protein